MSTIDLSPLYRNTVGFDHLAALLNTALGGEQSNPSYPPYDIAIVDDDRYTITLAVAGFSQNELELQVEQGVLTVRGKKEKSKEDERKYLYQGIANRTFERKFNLAEHIEVAGAEFDNGLLSIGLIKQIPEEMKPKSIAISKPGKVLEHQESQEKTA